MGAERGERLADLNLSTEEVSRFEKAFKDPKFRELFQDYAKEISDPAARAENDAYLRQIESEGKTGQVYGQGVEMVLPVAGFCVKTKDVASGRKVFINVCHSPKVAAVTSTAEKGGVSVQIPSMLSSSERLGTDKRGEPCGENDYCINTDAYNRSITEARFQRLIIETAIERVMEARNVKLDMDNYTMPKLPFKGPERPPVLTTREAKDAKKGCAAGAPKAGDLAKDPNLLRPVGTPGVDGVLSSTSLQSLNQHTLASTAGGGAVECTPPEPEATNSNARSSFAFGAPRKGSSASILSIPQEEAVGEVTPRHEMVYSGARDIGEAWNGGEGAGAAPRQTRPQALILRVALPKLESINSMALDVTAKKVFLHAVGAYKLEFDLPFEVEETRGMAKFEKTSRVLTTNLQESAGPPKPFIEPAPDPNVEEPAVNEVPVSGQEIVHSAVVAVLETENERHWREACDRQLQTAKTTTLFTPALDDVGAEYGDTSACEEMREFVAVDAFIGTRRGRVFKLGPLGLGYYRDVLPVVSTPPALAPALAPRKAPSLKPRLSAKVDELD